MMNKRGRKTVPVGTIIECSVCGALHAKKPKVRVCDDCKRVEAAIWSRAKYEQRKAQDTTCTLEDMRGALSMEMSKKWLRLSIRANL
jgi:hypothetical protein